MIVWVPIGQPPRSHIRAMRPPAKAVTTHPTISGWSHFNDDTWELYHTDTDRDELHDLAAEHPEKVSELVNLWFAEAGDNGVFPLDDRSPLEIFVTPRPLLARPVTGTPNYRDTAEVPEAQAVNVRNRSFSIGALVDIPAPGAQGVLFVHGSRFGGHALYIKDSQLHYVNNFVDLLLHHANEVVDVEQPVADLRRPVAQRQRRETEDTALVIC